MTDPRFARRGLGREAAAAVVAFAFERLGLDHLDATADAANVASIALARSLGFQGHARRRQAAGIQMVLRRWKAKGR